MRTSQNAHSLKLLAGSGVVAPPLYCCVSYVRTKRVRSCVHKKHNTRRYGRPLAGSLGPIGVRLCTLSRRRELRLNGVLGSSAIVQNQVLGSGPSQLRSSLRLTIGVYF